MNNYLFLLFTSFILACSNNHSSRAENKNDSKVKFLQLCSTCHGIDGTAQISGAKNLKKSILLEHEIYSIISEGRKSMPSYKHMLSSEELIDLSKFVKGLQKND